MIHDTIKQRMRASLLLGPAAGETLARAAHLARELRSDGTWQDVDYGREPSAEEPPAHLERTLALARARREAPGTLDAAFRRALDFWLARDFQFADWRCNQVRVPSLIGQNALLGENELSAGAREKTIEVLTRSRLSRWVPGAGWLDWTGADLLGMAYNVILRGCLENAPSLFDGAFSRIFRELRLAGPGEDGIQADLQFHGPSSAHSQGDGLVFAREIARFIALAHGTPWQAPAEGIKLFAAFLLDAQQWMAPPMNAGGTPLAAADGAALSRTESLAAAVGQLAQLGNPPRRQELLALSYRLLGEGAPLQGNRYFWRSRLAVHHRPGCSVRLHLGCSGPRLPAPAVGSPPGGRLYGCTEFLSASAPEDRVTRRLDADLLPGMTSAKPSVHLSRHAPAFRAEDQPFSAAVSDGEFGAAALRLADAELHGKKSWFFFDQALVCLGSGFRTPDTHAAIQTLVDERSFRGAARVWQPGDGRATPLRAGDRVQTLVERVEHAGFLYHFTGGAMVAVEAMAGQEGSSGQPPSARFSLAVDHGGAARSGGYAYTVLPCGGEEQGHARAAELAQLEVLANSPTVQAVRHRGLRLAQVVFWEAGVLRLPDGGRVAANQPCLLLCREDGWGETRLTVASLAAEPTILHVEYGGRCQCFDLPGGEEAGRSLSRVF